MNIVISYLLYFFIYSFLGWCCEVIYCSDFSKKEFVNRGMIKGPICPIYGVVACILIYFIYEYKNNILVVFFLGAFIATVIEYITSYLLEKIFNARWWDYSTYHFNINGRVCILNSSLFGILTVFLIRYIHLEIETIILGLNKNLIIIATIFIVLVFLVDLLSTIKNLKSMNKKLGKIRDLNKELKTINLKVFTDNKEEFEFNKKILDIESKILDIKRKFKKEKRFLKAFPRLKHKKFFEEVENIKKFLSDKNSGKDIK